MGTGVEFKNNKKVKILLKKFKKMLLYYGAVIFGRGEPNSIRLYICRKEVPMPRRARCTYKSKFFHVMAQGIEKRYIYNTKQDFAYFKAVLINAARELKIEIIAFCIMNNHYHMLVKVDDIQMLSAYIHKINTKYGLYFNKKYNRVGYVFRNRFKSQEILEERYYYNCIKYIFYNPVKAGMCKDPMEYEYSNILEFINNKKNLDNFNLDYDCNFIDVEEDLLSCREIISSFVARNNISEKYIIAEKEKLKELIILLNKVHGFSYREISDELGIKQGTLRNIAIK